MSKNMIQTIRWILTFSSAIAGYFLAFLLAAISYEVAESFCPNSQFVSEHCIAPYMNIFEDVSVVVFPTVAALLVVWLPYIFAPKHKMVVAASCYVIGVGVAVYFAISTQLWVTLVSAILSAGLLVWYLARSNGKNS